MPSWYWLVAGVVLILLEIATPSFIVIWFGIAALLTGIASLWIHSTTGQVLFFTLSSLLSFLVGWFGFVRRWKVRSNAGQGKESVLGEVGIVSQVRRGEFTEGIVRFQIPVLGTDEWSFVSDDPLSVGDRCVIVDIVGNRLKVKKGGMP